MQVIPMHHGTDKDRARVENSEATVITFMQRPGRRKSPQVVITSCDMMGGQG
jgi:hypothetical protein